MQARRKEESVEEKEAWRECGQEALGEGMSSRIEEKRTGRNRGEGHTEGR